MWYPTQPVLGKVGLCYCVMLQCMWEGSCGLLLDTLRDGPTIQNNCVTLAREKNAIYFVSKQSALPKCSYTVLNFIWRKNESIEGAEDSDFSLHLWMCSVSIAALKAGLQSP